MRPIFDRDLLEMAQRYRSRAGAPMKRALFLDLVDLVVRARNFSDPILRLFYEWAADFQRNAWSGGLTI